MPALATNHELEFEELSGLGGMRVTKEIRSPEGKKLRAVVAGTHAVLTIEAQPPHTIMVTGDAPLTIDLLGQIGDILGDALSGLVKLLQCKPETITTIETHKDGTVKAVTETRCAAS